MNELKPFDDKLSGLLASLSPAGRRKMAAEIAKNCVSASSSALSNRKRLTTLPMLSESVSLSGGNAAGLSGRCSPNCERRDTSRRKPPARLRWLNLLVGCSGLREFIRRV